MEEALEVTASWKDYKLLVESLSQCTSYSSGSSKKAGRDKSNVCLESDVDGRGHSHAIYLYLCSCIVDRGGAARAVKCRTWDEGEGHIDKGVQVWYLREVGEDSVGGCG